VLPGTLLGLFPGVIVDPAIPVPPTPKRSLRPYLKRYDGYWLDYLKEMPYPLPNVGANYEDLHENFEHQASVRGNNELKLTLVDPVMMNPYAVGHLINHPPPDVGANV